MRQYAMAFCILLFFASIAHASPPDRPILATESGLIHGGPADPAAIKADTIQIMGPNRPEATWSYFGDFETAGGAADWNGWTSIDLTAVQTQTWSVSTYNAENLHGNGSGNLAAWCGQDFASCGAGDPDGGYGNDWDTWIEYAYEVPDTNVVLNTTIDFWINYDLETASTGDDEDLIQILAFTTNYATYPAGYAVLGEFRGTGSNEHASAAFRYYPNSYVDNDGDGLDNDVVFWIRTVTGPDTSDEDCGYGSAGAGQIDDITVNLIGLHIDFDDFEGGDLSSSNWTAPNGVNVVGDFANLADNLGDVDECRTNTSYQVNFVDTGFYIAQGLMPQPGLTWTYGPQGYIVQNQGGLTFDNQYGLDNAVRSPVMAWPDQDLDGALLEWNMYLHAPLGPDDPEFFTFVKVRSTVSDDPADIEIVSFQSDGWAYYGGPGYYDLDWLCSSDLVPGRKWVQVELEVWEFAYSWGTGGGMDGTPAPYFDNVRFRAFSTNAPAMSARDVDLAQDGFPASGTVDTADLGNNSIRFDMAGNIGGSGITPGDSLVVTVAPLGTGATLVRAPRMYFALKENALYDALRSNAPAADFVEGQDLGDNLWAFDLPDEHFLFPGDVVHYYFEGLADVGGEQYLSVLPADTTGFHAFAWPVTYDRTFTWRGLPTMHHQSGQDYAYASCLIWNDQGAGAETERAWQDILNHLNLSEGVGYDTYVTRAPTSLQGNGLGGRATAAQIGVYPALLYTSGTLSTGTLSNGDGGDDIGLLTAWLESGDRGLYLTGDNLVADLNGGGSAQAAFLSDWLGLTLQSDDLRPLIAGQSAPLVERTAGNPVFLNIDEWVADGSCQTGGSLNTFDAVVAGSGAVRLAEFTDPYGSMGIYTYSAATLFVDPTSSSRVISMPYDFAFIADGPGTAKASAALSTGGRVLRDVLLYLDVYDPIGGVIPAAGRFTTRLFPNPFNPVTRIDYNLPRAEHLGIKVYNLRGELVRTLIDEQREAGPGFVVWDGKNAGGADQASGVYFYEARTADDVAVGKMTLMK